MHKLTHLKVASIVKETIEREFKIKLDNLSFMYGSIKPDISYKYVRISHFKHKSNGFLEQLIDKLSKTKINNYPLCTKEFSEEMGILTHYLSDFFCHAHKENIKFNLLTHYLYELKLEAYFLKRRKYIRSLNLLSKDALAITNSIYPTSNDFIETLHKNYISKNHSYGIDVLYTLKACTYLLSRILIDCTNINTEKAA